MVDVGELRIHGAWLERMKKVWGLVGTELPDDTIDGWNELVEEFRMYAKDAQKMTALREKWYSAPVRRDVNEIRATVPLFKEINKLYTKYEFSKRRAKRKILNEKLSKNYRNEDRLYAGRKTYHYTGIETPTTT